MSEEDGAERVIGNYNNRATEDQDLLSNMKYRAGCLYSKKWQKKFFCIDDPNGTAETNKFNVQLNANIITKAKQHQNDRINFLGNNLKAKQAIKKKCVDRKPFMFKNKKTPSGLNHMTLVNEDGYGCFQNITTYPLDDDFLRTTNDLNETVIGEEHRGNRCRLPNIIMKKKRDTNKSMDFYDRLKLLNNGMGERDDKHFGKDQNIEFEVEKFNPKKKMNFYNNFFCIKRQSGGYRYLDKMKCYEGYNVNTIKPKTQKKLGYL